MLNKMVYDCEREATFSGVVGGRLRFFCDSNGYIFAKIRENTFWPVFYDGEHVSVENQKFDYGRCLDRGVFSVGAADENVTESVVRWSDLSQGLPPKEEIARLKEKVVELSEKVVKLSDMILGFQAVKTDETSSEETNG